MSKSSRIRSSIFEKHHGWISFLSAVICTPDGSVHRLLLRGKESFQILSFDHPFALAPKYNELNERGHLTQPTESPIEKHDR
jgi:hypothetical protein